MIYDYQGYIDHMCDCKLNTLIIWNDYVLLNAAEVVAYAHAHDVKVIFGFSWCWGGEGGSRQSGGPEEVGGLCAGHL